MRILFMATSRGDGGIERHSAYLAKRLIEAGDNVSFVCSMSSIVFETCASLQVPTIPLRVRNSTDLAAVYQLVCVLIRNKTNILHVHSRRDYMVAALSVGLARPFCKVRLVLHLHLIRSLGSPDRLSGRFFGKLAAKIFAVSKAVKQTVMDLNDVPSDKIAVIYNGLREADFHARGSDSWSTARTRTRSALGIPEDRFVLIMIGRLDAKGQDAAVATMPAIVQAIPNASLLLVGSEGKPGQSDELRNATIQNGCSDILTISGPRSDVAECLAASDLILHLPTDDALPTVLIEAMFASLPAVATAIGGIPEIVCDGVTGILVESNDAGTIAAAVHLAQSRYDELSAASKERAVRVFSAASQLETIKKYYTEICN